MKDCKILKTDRFLQIYKGQIHQDGIIKNEKLELHFNSDDHYNGGQVSLGSIPSGILNNLG